MAVIHCSGSNCFGLKIFGLAVPSPHSRSRKVLVPKCRMTPNSRSCHCVCCGAGLMSGKLCAAAAMQPRNVARVALRSRALLIEAGVTVCPYFSFCFDCLQYGHA